MIKGIGIDLENINRIGDLASKKPALVERILTVNEREIYHSFDNKKRQLEFLSGRYVAKEAFSKALGTGIGADLSFLDIEILPQISNQPRLQCTKFHGRVHVSIAHTSTLAMAEVLLEE